VVVFAAKCQWVVKAHTQKFWVANLTSRENQTRQAAVAVSSHAPFRKWRLTGASAFDASRSRGRVRGPNTGALWGLPFVYRNALHRGDGRRLPPHRAEYPRTARRRANLKNFLPTARRLNLPRNPATNPNRGCVPRVLVGRRRRAIGPALQVVGMSREIIRLSIPIGTIAISSVAVFAFSWVGLALLGY